MAIIKYDDSVLQRNKERFLGILLPAVTNRTSEETANNLKNYLESTTFFTDPASTKYHACYKGGLCKHSLNVYDNLWNLVTGKGLLDTFSSDSLAIVALLHDISKNGLYEEVWNNRKVYCEDGDKWDDGGKFTWKVEPGYKIKDEDVKFVYGSHEENSEYIASHLVKLTMDESRALLSHHGTMSWDSAKPNLSEIYNQSPLSCLLHLADMMATYIDETTLGEKCLTENA